MVVMLLGLMVQAQELKTYDQFFLEAMVQRQKGNNDAAFDLLRHCQELNPDAPEVYFFLGQYYSLLKNTEKSQLRQRPLFLPSAGPRRQDGLRLSDRLDACPQGHRALQFGGQ